MQEQLSSHRTSIHSKMFWKMLVDRLKLKCLTGSRDGSGLVSHHCWSTLSSLLFLLFLPVPHPLSDLFVFILQDFTLPRPSPKQNESICPRVLHHPLDQQLLKDKDTSHSSLSSSPSTMPTMYYNVLQLCTTTCKWLVNKELIFFHHENFHLKDDIHKITKWIMVLRLNLW